MNLLSLINIILKVINSQTMSLLNPLPDKGKGLLMHLNQVFLLLQQLHNLKELIQVDLHDKLLNHSLRVVLPQLAEVIRHFLNAFHVFVFQVFVQQVTSLCHR